MSTESTAPPPPKNRKRAKIAIAAESVRWSGTGLADLFMVATHLSIGHATMSDMIRDGRFGPAAHKIGRAKRYLQEEVDAWILAGMPRKEAWASQWQQHLEARTPKARKR